MALLFNGSMKQGYNNAAFFYDRLARLVFDNKLLQAQAAYLHLVPADARVLIIGGGTGWLLEELARVLPGGKLSITYVEAAPAMVALAQQRILKSKVLEDAPFLINFMTAPIESVMLDGNYDVVITPFLFDNFSDYDAGAIVSKVQQHLAPRALWLYTDFRDNGNRKHRLLLKIMYRFFSLICGVKANRLPDMFRVFDKHGFIALHGKAFINGFVESKVYIKK